MTSVLLIHQSKFKFSCFKGGLEKSPILKNQFHDVKKFCMAIKLTAVIFVTIRNITRSVIIKLHRIKNLQVFSQAEQ